MARPRLAALAASLALFGGAGVVAFLPLATSGCPAAVASVLADPIVVATTEPPVQNRDEVAADAAAVEATSLVVADASTRNLAARQGVSEAEQSAHSSGNGVTTSRVSARQHVDQAQTALDAAEVTLATDLANRNAYPVGDPAYTVHDDLVAEDRLLIETLRGDLADAKIVLEGASAVHASVEAATVVLDQTATELAAAQASLDAARMVQSEHQAAFTPVYTAWQVSERAAAASADAERRCQEGGRSRLIVAGLIAVVGGALGSYSFVQRR